MKLNRYFMRKLANRFLRGELLNVYRRLHLSQRDRIFGRTISYYPYTDIGRKLFYHGEWSRDEFEICRRYVREQSVVLDIGANVGLYSVFFASLASDGLVLAFEPAVETYRLLSKNVEGLNNVVPLNVGVSDSDEIAKFFVMNDDAYSSLKDTRRKKINKVHNILCCKLDTLLMGMNIKGIDFIKIDVEGFEDEVLKGMGNLIDTYHPIIFCEIYKGTNSNDDPEETVNYLLEKGYQANVIKGGELTPYIGHDDTFYNYLFLPRTEQTQDASF